MMDATARVGQHTVTGPMRRPDERGPMIDWLADHAWVTWVGVAVVLAVVSTALLLLVRPPLLERLHAGPTLQTGHQNLVGLDALVIEPVDSRSGRVKLATEVWTARTDGDESFDTGVEVRVIRIDGATAVVTGKES